MLYSNEWLQILVFCYYIIDNWENIKYYMLSAGAAAHFHFFFSCWVKEIWLQAKPAFTQHFSFILKVVTRPIHFTSWVGVEITGFCMVRFTIFFPFPFSLHNVFIPAILLKCGFSEGAVISLLSFLMLRGQLCKQCPVHFYLINGCRNECFF